MLSLILKVLRLTTFQGINFTHFYAEFMVFQIQNPNSRKFVSIIYVIKNNQMIRHNKRNVAVLFEPKSFKPKTKSKKHDIKQIYTVKESI